MRASRCSLRISADVGRDLGDDMAGGNGVDVDTGAGPVVGQGHGELPDPAHAGGIAGDEEAAPAGEERGGEDDLARATGENLPAKLAGEDEPGAVVDLKNLVPGVVRMLGGGEGTTIPTFLRRISTRSTSR